MLNPMKPYPIFLIGLEKRHCIFIGGGHEAEFKVKGLLDCDATVTVIHPTLTPQLEVWADEALFTWIKRPFQPGDLHGAFFVMAERSDPETNALIWEEAEREGCLVNVMDDVQHCNFVAGSVVRRGPLTLSISTSGAAPALSVRMRERFEKELGPEYETFLTWMQALRPPMAATHPSFQERKALWYELMDSDVLDLMKNGRLPEAREQIAEILAIDPLPDALFEGELAKS